MILTSYQENIPKKHTLLPGAYPVAPKTALNGKKLLNDLYRNHSSELLFTILKIIPQYETAQDVLHDAFLKIDSRINTYDAGRSQLLTWSKAIAHNVAIDHLRLKTSRNNKLNQSLEFSQNQLGIKHSCNFNPDGIGLKQLISLLSTQQLAILELFYYEGYTHEEIAETLNIPLGTIKTRIRTAIITLRKFF
ncbi:MAG: sigma-70 family RNA polymerase sigma factor [Sphingobacteriales bacterium]|nr:MAG: sigma-70 family RNA polymerase sigma factor [Sphingobacteriales bacterium]